jgi:hypothetical protein
VRTVWALYASALIKIWQRIVNFNISWDSDVLGKVIRKRGIFTVVPSVRDRRAVDICLTLITSNPRFTNPCEMFSTGAEAGRYRITVVASRFVYRPCVVMASCLTMPSRVYCAVA